MDPSPQPRPTPPGRRPRLRSALVTTFVLGILGLMAYGLIRKAPDTTIDNSLADGRLAVAPGFELEVLDAGDIAPPLPARLRRAFADRRLALGELRGTPAVVNLWASWCAPCRDEAELLQQTWRVARRQGVLFLGINMQDARSDARAFLRKFEIDYPTVRESGRDTARAYGATGLPETYFVTANGMVAGHHVGPVEAAELKAGIDAARSGQPLSAQAVGPTPGLRLVPRGPTG